MRISSVALFCAVGFIAWGGSHTLASDEADIEKETRKFQGTWTIESSESGGNAASGRRAEDARCDL